MDLSVYCQRSQMETNLKFHLSYSSCSQWKKREKEYSFQASVLKKEGKVFVAQMGHSKYCHLPTC